MKKLLLCLLLPLLAYAAPADSLTYTVKEVTRVLGNCDKEGCIQVNISYPVFSDPAFPAGNAVLRKINAEMEIFALNNFYGDGMVLNSAEALADSFINQMKVMFAELGADPLTYSLSLNRSFEVTFNQGGVLSVVLSEAGYTGGAHGFVGVTAHNYLLSNGYEITGADLFTEEDETNALTYAEGKFRSEVGISDTADLNESGFWFRRNAFHLPKNFYITPEALMLHYNAYEVAPWAAGEIEIELPFTDIKKYLSTAGYLSFLFPATE